MITKEELQEYARLVGLNIGQAEKDYFQNVLLFIIYQNYGKNIVFKGGTALKKCYGLERFSEDLDFTCLNGLDLKTLESGMKRFDLEFETETKKYENGLKITFRIRGPLYIGIRQSLCRFIADLSFRENVILKPQIKTIGRFLEEIPSFDVFVMQEKEILAEKVRATMTRAKARDVYDLWFLLEKGTELDPKLISKKLEYYNQRWDPKKLEKGLKMKKTLWMTELHPLVKTVPDYRMVKKVILEKVSG